MFAKFFIDRPIFAWVIALIILLAGILALRGLPVAQYPSVAPPALSVTATYSGASAQVVEETVVALLEQEMNGLENLLYMESAAELGRGSITLTFEAGTNLDLASVEAQNRIKRAEARLPEEVRRMGITVAKSARNYVMIVALVSPDKSMDNVALGSYAAANVLDSVKRVPGVGEALMFGTEYSMRLWLKPEKLQGYGLTPAGAEATLTELLRSEPLRVAGAIDPRRSLAVIALWDRVIGWRNSLDIWRALGRPQTIWLPTGHYTSLFALPYIKLRVLWFFQDWSKASRS